MLSVMLEDSVLGRDHKKVTFVLDAGSTISSVYVGDVGKADLLDLSSDMKEAGEQIKENIITT